MSYNLEQLGCQPYQVNQFGPEGNGSYVYCTPSGSQNSCFQFQNPVDVWVCPSIPVPGAQNGVVQNGFVQPGVAAQNAYLQNQALQNGQAYLQSGQALQGGLGQAYLQNGAGQAFLQNGLGQALQGGLAQNPQALQSLAQGVLGARTF
nr:hypothetical protein Cplu_409 [Cedratvirus plubellavi]